MYEQVPHCVVCWTELCWDCGLGAALHGPECDACIARYETMRAAGQPFDNGYDDGPDRLDDHAGPKRQGAKWDGPEDDRLLGSYRADVSIFIIAKRHERTPTAIWHHLEKLGEVSWSQVPEKFRPRFKN